MCWKSCIVIIVLAIILHPSTAGFLYGAPCSARNLIQITTDGFLPSTMREKDIQCVDITSAGKIANVIKHKAMIGHATTMYADHMLLKKIPVALTNSMRFLELIDFNGNRLKQIKPHIFSKHKHLITLLFADNQLTIPSKRPFLISPALTTLSLSGNKIKKLSRETFMQLPALQVIYLDSNFIEEVQPDYFSHLKKLVYLHLGNNKLTTKPSMCMFPKGIRTLIFKDNPFNTTSGLETFD